MSLGDRNRARDGDRRRISGRMNFVSVQAAMGVPPEEIERALVARGASPVEAAAMVEHGSRSVPTFGRGVALAAVGVALALGGVLALELVASEARILAGGGLVAVGLFLAILGAHAAGAARAGPPPAGVSGTAPPSAPGSRPVAPEGAPVPAAGTPSAGSASPTAPPPAADSGSKGSA